MKNINTFSDRNLLITLSSTFLECRYSQTLNTVHTMYRRQTMFMLYYKLHVNHAYKWATFDYKD